MKNLHRSFLLAFFLSSISLNASAIDWGKLLSGAGAVAEGWREAEMLYMNPNVVFDRWDKAYLQEERRTGDYSIQNCLYRTVGGFEFSINIRKITCPYSVYLNVESMQVRVPY